MNLPLDAGRTILVDLRVAQYNADRGIPAYAQSLVWQICRDHPENRYLFLWDRQAPLPSWADAFADFGTWAVEADLAAGKFGRIDVLLTACFFLPLYGRGGEYLYPRWLQRHHPWRLGIVYDLIPLLFPDRYLTCAAARQAYMDAFHVMRDTDRLFAISQTTRRDVIRLAAVGPHRVHCIYGAVDHRKRGLIENPGPPDAGLLARHGLRPPYAVYVGGDDWRKNMPAMVHAFAHFHALHPDRQLAVVCKLPPERIAEFRRLAGTAGVRDGAIVFTGYVSDEELVGITKAAEMMVYPSLYEGLGLPILEAYGCGVPVVGSGTSSVAELVLPDLSCDPEQPRSIALAMDRLVGSASLRQESLALGGRLLGELTWPAAAAGVMRQLRRPAPPRLRGREAVAVVGALPPAGTAIAAYTLRHLQSPRWRTDFFDANPGPDLAPAAGLLPGNRLLPVEVLETALARGDQGTVLFVLGNSAHHVKVLRAALQSRLGCRQRRLAYLHEVNLKVLLRAFPEAADVGRPSPVTGPLSAPDIQRTLAAVPEIGRSLRFLLDTAGFDGVIVNSAATRDLIRGSLGAAAARWSIDVALLPVPRLPAAASRAAGSVLHVGSFGTASDTKRLASVARSLALLARHRPVRFSIVGWHAARHCRRLGIDTLPFVEIHDAPCDAAFDRLMAAVDVGVQLRWPTHGETSAAVLRLMAHGKQVVVTRAGSFAELPPELLTSVPPDCGAADLALAIEAAAARQVGQQQLAAALAPLTADAFTDRMAAILGRADPVAQAAG